MKIPVGYCGLYCGECAIYLACHRKEHGPQVSRPDKSSLGDIVCEGCRSDDSSCYGKDCEIRQCARARKVTLCCECPEYVCGKLSAFYSDPLVVHGQSRKNLEEIQHIGLPAWLENKQKKS